MPTFKLVRIIAGLSGTAFDGCQDLLDAASTDRSVSIAAGEQGRAGSAAEAGTCGTPEPDCG